LLAVSQAVLGVPLSLLLDSLGALVLSASASGRGPKVLLLRDTGARSRPLLLARAVLPGSRNARGHRFLNSLNASAVRVEHYALLFDYFFAPALCREHSSRTFFMERTFFTKRIFIMKRTFTNTFFMNTLFMKTFFMNALFTKTFFMKRMFLGGQFFGVVSLPPS
jgi:hypothetical protein